jgi:hypothetical protein
MTPITFQTLFKKESLITLLKIFIPGIIILVIGAICHLIFKVPFSHYSRDPIQVLEGKPYVGVISNVGILLWTASASILFFSAILGTTLNIPKRLVQFLVYGGVLTSLMLMDDMFLFHDVIFPEYLNISQSFFYISYGIILIIYLYLYKSVLLTTDYILLLAAFGLFAASVAVDEFVENVVELPAEYLVEDSFKLLGIISWFAFFTRTCYVLVKMYSKK